MIRTVRFSGTEYADPPQKFEAGTPPMAEVIGFGAALTYLERIGWFWIVDHEVQLIQYALQQLRTIPGLMIFGLNDEASLANRVGVISFVMRDAHPHDIATILDSVGVTIRAGHHCAMPLMERFKVPAMARVSFGLYTTRQDVDRLIEGLHRVLSVFGASI